MKLAITSKGTTLDSEVDPRFGRAGYFVIVDSETLDFEVVDNSKNANAFKGAGIQAATAVGSKGAEVLMTGYCGPNAFKTLNAAGVKIVNDTTGTIKDAVETFNNGNCKYAEDANTDGHW